MARMVSSCVRVKQLFLRLRQLGLGSGVFRVLWPHISLGISFVQTFGAAEYFSYNFRLFPVLDTSTKYLNTASHWRRHKGFYKDWNLFSGIMNAQNLMWECGNAFEADMRRLDWILVEWIWKYVYKMLQRGSLLAFQELATRFVICEKHENIKCERVSECTMLYASWNSQQFMIQ